MECSVCQSTNLVKVSLAYEQGLSEYKGSRARAAYPSERVGWASGAAGRKQQGRFRPVFQRASALRPRGRIGRHSSGGWRGFHPLVRGNRSAGECSQCQGIQPCIRLDHGCLCRRSGLFVVAHLAIQPPRVSGSAQTLGPFVHMPMLRRDYPGQRLGDRRPEAV